MHPYNQDHLPLQGIILLTLIATFDPLRPQPRDNGSRLCIPPLKLQYGVLYTSLALSCIGSGADPSPKSLIHASDPRLQSAVDPRVQPISAFSDALNSLKLSPLCPAATVADPHLRPDLPSSELSLSSSSTCLGFFIWFTNFGSTSQQGMEFDIKSPIDSV
ncbi:protein nrt1/ ptr family 2.3 [Quercus suber]|uniref:Protein nrt1/ ptr family 2.3 n=1 Tax=Quercus suber TaxID=58331 RepID=A0AAW0KM44_QUESU